MTAPHRPSSQRPPGGPLASAARAAGAVLGAAQAAVGVALRPVRTLARATVAARDTRRRAQTRSQQTLRSLYEQYPDARQAARRTRGVMVVPLEQIVGTERHPSQNTADFLPLPQLRGHNWRSRWQRIGRAVDRLAVLPPISVVKVGDEYFVSDGHNRVAAALRARGVGIDAEVTELILPGVPSGPPPQGVASSLAEGVLLREAASGRFSRTAPATEPSEVTDREEILRTPRGDEDPARSRTDSPK